MCVRRESWYYIRAKKTCSFQKVFFFFFVINAYNSLMGSSKFLIYRARNTIACRFSFWLTCHRRIEIHAVREISRVCITFIVNEKVQIFFFLFLLELNISFNMKGKKMTFIFASFFLLKNFDGNLAIIYSFENII